MLTKLKNLRDDLYGKKDDGFTIVEVMIVLAIAGLIILIVFLAVPALQRNSRNTQRSNDASMIGGAFNECLNAKNGVKSSCDDWSSDIAGKYMDTSKLKQLTTYKTSAPADTEMDQFYIQFGKKCEADGSNVSAAAAGARAAVVLYNIENTTSKGELHCQEI